jgi:superfamily I DNA/RNA helicase
MTRVFRCVFDSIPPADDEITNSCSQKVVLTTVHAAKGLEWPVVFIPCGQCDDEYIDEDDVI